MADRGPVRQRVCPASENRILATNGHRGFSSSRIDVQEVPQEAEHSFPFAQDEVHSLGRRSADRWSDGCPVWMELVLGVAEDSLRLVRFQVGRLAIVHIGIDGCSARALRVHRNRTIFHLSSRGGCQTYTVVGILVSQFRYANR
jgi:hypothetical protein